MCFVFEEDNVWRVVRLFHRFSVPRAGIEPANPRRPTRRVGARAESLCRLAYLGMFMQVVLDGIEPSFPACKTGVVAVGPQD